MTLLQALLLSVVEGVTEFLPVSSTGHMILTSALLGIDSSFVRSFEVIIQLGAILAVLTLYRKKLDTNVLIAFIPTAIIGLILYRYIKDVLLGNPMIVVWSLAAGGVALLLLERFHKERSVPMTGKRAFLIGVAQSLSIVPGVSRAAASVVGAMLLGINRKDAVEFSFLLAIPTMAAATGLDLVNNTFSRDQAGILAVGFVGAFSTALVTVRWFIKYIGHHTFVPFAWYRIGVALLFYILIH